MAYKPLGTDLTREKFTRYFSGSTNWFCAVSGIRNFDRSPEEIAKGVDSQVIAFEIYELVYGTATFTTGVVSISSAEFNRSPRYYIDAEQVPETEVPQQVMYRSEGRSVYWIKTRLGTYETELNLPVFLSSKKEA